LSSGELSVSKRGHDFGSLSAVHRHVGSKAVTQTVKTYSFRQASLNTNRAPGFGECNGALAVGWGKYEIFVSTDRLAGNDSLSCSWQSDHSRLVGTFACLVRSWRKRQQPLLEVYMGPPQADDFTSPRAR
jgi:hypothetical protein